MQQKNITHPQKSSCCTVTVVTCGSLVQMGHDQMQHAAHLAGMQAAGNRLCMWVPSKALHSPSGAAPSLFSQHSVLTGRGGISSMSNRETATNGMPGGNNTSSDSGPSIHERSARHVYISRMIERAAASTPTVAMKNNEGTGSGGEEATADNCTTKLTEGSAGVKGSTGEAGAADGDGASGNDESKAGQMEYTAGGSHISGRAGCSPSDDECTESVRGDEGDRCDGAATRADSAQHHAMPRCSDAIQSSTPIAAEGGAAVLGGASQSPQALPCMIAGAGGALNAGVSPVAATQWAGQGQAANGQGPPIMGQICLPAGAMLPVGVPGGVVAPAMSGPTGEGFTIAALQQPSACFVKQQSNASNVAASAAQCDAQASVPGKIDGEKAQEASAKKSGAGSTVRSAGISAGAPSVSQGPACTPACAPLQQMLGGKQLSGEAAGAKVTQSTEVCTSLLVAAC